MFNKYKTVFIVAAMYLLAHSSSSAQKLVDKIIAQVGTEIVLLSELEGQYQYEIKRNNASTENLRCNLLEGMLIENLLLAQAELDSIVIPDDQVEAQLDARMDQILRMMNNDIDRLQQFYGESLNQLKNRVRGDMRKQMMIQQMQSEIVNSVDITPSEVIDFYNSIPTDSLPLFNSEVEIAEIVVKPEPNEEEKQKARESLERLRQRILDGEDFQELAKIYSDDPGSARQGGNLGMLGRGMLVPEYEATAFALEEGELSQVIESIFGFHLIQLIERRGNNFNSRHILVKPSITAADRERAQQKLLEAKDEILNDSLSFGMAVKKYSDEEVQSYNNGGRVTNPKTGNTFFEIQDLEDPDVFFALDTMEVGDISPIIEVRNQRGERYYKIVKLLSRTQPHRASLEKDYSKVQEMARNFKRNAVLAEWIDKNVNQFYIQLDEEFLGCPNLQSWNIEPARP